MANCDSSQQALVEWLENRHRQIMAHENDALKALDAGNVNDYREDMRRKAECLASMHGDSQPLLSALSPDLRPAVEAALSGFSSSAQTSLGLNSVFYMSALLYPDTHKAGEPDNLELFIAGLKSGNPAP